MAEDEKAIRCNYERQSQYVEIADQTNEQRENKRRQKDTNRTSHITEEELHEHRLRRRYNEMHRLAQMNEEQIAERKERRRQQARLRQRQMTEQQLIEYRERRRQQQRQRRERNRDNCPQNISSSTTLAETILAEGDCMDEHMLNRQPRMVKEQVANRRARNREYERNRLARMSEEQLSKHRERRRQQERHRRQQNKQNRFQHARVGNQSVGIIAPKGVDSHQAVLPNANLTTLDLRPTEDGLRYHQENHLFNKGDQKDQEGSANEKVKESQEGKSSQVKAVAKAIANSEKSEEKTSRSKNKIQRVQSAMSLND